MSVLPEAISRRFVDSVETADVAAPTIAGAMAGMDPLRIRV